MLCPVCNKEMTVVERNGVELDRCIFCEGFWFDSGEWNILCKKLISENFIDEDIDIYEIPKVKSGEKSRKCPVCGCKTEKFIFNGVLLDRCPNKHGIWFDKNEFSTCVNSVRSQTSVKEQIMFLGEIFNK